MSCKICETRRPRRHCPGVGGEICAPCCGAGREATVDCPIDCEYLVEAHDRERRPPLDPGKFPNPGIQVTQDLIREHAELLLCIGRAVIAAQREEPGIRDDDVREAIESLIRTQRTLDSGLIYETRPDNAVAARLAATLRTAITEFRNQETARLGMTRTRDADVLGLLAFFQRLEIDRNNGRLRGRAFLGFLRKQFGARN